MSTLAEIEAAAETLPARQKQELFEFLAARLGYHVSNSLADAGSGNRLPFPLIEGTSGVVIAPTKEQLSEF
jgi:hypothetical protein